MLCLICKSRCPVAVTWTVNVGLCTTVCLRSMPIVRVALLALHLETTWPARMYCSRYGLCARRCCSRYEFFAELCLQLYDICLHTPPHPPPPAPADHGMMVVNSNLKGAAADHGMMVVMANMSGAVFDHAMMVATATVLMVTITIFLRRGFKDSPMPIN